MKKLSSQLMLCAIFILPALTFAQNLSGTVHSVLNVGAYDYSYIYVEEEGVYYKTAAYSQGLLINSMNVDINIGQVPNSEFNAYVSSDDVQIGVYATRIETDNFNMPLTSTYGMPVLENEILFFLNQDHFEEFSEILEGFSNSPFEETIDLLHVFEDQYIGFTSFNTMLETLFDWEDGDFTEEQLDLRPKQDYLKDYTLKAIVNEYGEMGIGNEVLTMTSDSKGEIIYTNIFNDSQIDEINDKREISIYDNDFINLIPFDGKTYKGNAIVGKSQTTVVYNSSVNGDSELTYHSRLNLETVSNCNKFAKGVKVTMWESRTYPDGEAGLLGLDAGNFSGYMNVFWGDGTSETVALVAPGNLKKEYSLLHVYPSVPNVSSYYAKTIMYFDSGTSSVVPIVMTDSIYIYIADVTCSDEEILPEKVTKYYNSGDNRMVAESWVKNFAKWKTIGTSTDSYKKKNNGNWRKVRGHIQANIYYTLRSQGGCAVSKTGSKVSSGYRKHIQSKKSYRYSGPQPQGVFNNVTFTISNDEVHSSNICHKHGETASTIIKLNPCP